MTNSDFHRSADIVDPDFVESVEVQTEYEKGWAAGQVALQSLCDQACQLALADELEIAALKERVKELRMRLTGGAAQSAALTAEDMKELELVAVLMAPLGSRSGEARWKSAQIVRKAVAALAAQSSPAATVEDDRTLTQVVADIRALGIKMTDPHECSSADIVREVLLKARRHITADEEFEADLEIARALSLLNEPQRSASTGVDLVTRLGQHVDGDHKRGCMGRQYSCSCGYDATTESLLSEALNAVGAQAMRLDACDSEIARIRAAPQTACRFDQDGQTCPTCGRVGNGEG